MGRRLWEWQEGDWEVTVWWLCHALTQVFSWRATESHGNVQRQQEVNSRWMDASGLMRKGEVRLETDKIIHV